MKQVLAVCSSVLFLGCYAAPREVAVTIELGPQRVVLGAELLDVRTPMPDPLGQLRAFEGVSAWQPTWTDDLPWAPSPTRFEYSTDGGQLDLLLRAELPRAQFDACARSVDAGCRKFPLVLAEGRYSVDPEVLQSLVVDASQPTSWAADAGRITFRFALRPADAPFLKAGGFSLAPAFLLFRGDPLAASETVRRAAQLEETFRSRRLDLWTQELERERACRGEPWCGLRQDAIELERLRLVHGYLYGLPEGGYGIQGPPPEFGFLRWAPDLKRPPRLEFPLVDELRLRVAYDLLMAEYHRSGHPRPSLKGWSDACRAKKARTKSFCALLGAEP